MALSGWNSIQRHLKKRHFDPGPADGIRGARTIAAVKAFQKASGLVVNGIVGRKTRAALFGTDVQIDCSGMICASMAALSRRLHPARTGSADADLQRDFGLEVTDRGLVKGVKACMLNNGCLLIPGSKSFTDHVRFNLRVLKPRARQLSLSYHHADKAVFSEKTKTGASRMIGHQGFFSHATAIFRWIGKDQSKRHGLIVGHSPDVASAQILSRTFVSPAIGFAAPRLRKTDGPVRHDHLSLSFCRDDDIVCTLPGGFHHTGQIRQLIHKKRKRGLNHYMKAYIDALENQKRGLNIPTVRDP